MLPPPITLPGVADTGMDYAQPSPGMDEISRRMGVEDNIHTQAESAVLDKNFNQQAWIKDASANFAEGEKVASGAPDLGNSEYAQAAEVLAHLRQKERSGVPLTPEEQDMKALAMNKVAPTTSSTTMGTEGPVTNITRPDPFYTPGAAAQPSGVPGVTVETQQPQADAAPAPAAAVPAGVGPGNVPVTSTNVAGMNITSVGKKSPKPLTEYENKAKFYSTRVGTAFQQLAPMLGIDLETGVYDPSKAQVGGLGDAAMMAGDRIMSNVFGSEFEGAIASGPQQQFTNASIAMLNPVVRFDSGATTPEPEFSRARQEFIPGPMNDTQASFEKIVRLQATIGAMEDIARITGVDPAMASDDQLRQWKASGITDKLIQKNIAEITANTPAAPQTPADPAAPAAPAAAAPPSQLNIPAPPGIDPRDWAHMSNEDKLLWQTPSP
jgi:hypothetical protein